MCSRFFEASERRHEGSGCTYYPPEAMALEETLAIVLPSIVAALVCRMMPLARLFVKLQSATIMELGIADSGSTMSPGPTAAPRLPPCSVRTRGGAVALPSIASTVLRRITARPAARPSPGGRDDSKREGCPKSVPQT